MGSDGNTAGVTSTIGSPAADPQVISVGATTSLRLRAQLGDAGSGGRWANDNIADFSSSGFTDEGRTIDLVAPGNAGWAACTRSYRGCRNAHGDPSDIFAFAGTSQSAPFTSGAAALVIQAYRQVHYGQSPAPALVKQLLASTARDLGAQPVDQGTGLLDVGAAVRAARARPAAPSPDEPSLLLWADQLDLSGEPGRTRHAALTATNAGGRPLTVTPTMLRYVPQSHTTRQVSLPTGGTPAPVPITVPPGAAQLTVRALIPGAPGGSYRLYAPDGTLENVSTGLFTATQTLSALHPAQGTWTLQPPADLTGTLTVATDTTRAEPVGDMPTGPFTLAPGASRTVPVSLTIPASSGDYGYQVRLATSNGTATSVPAIVRTLVPTGPGAGTFSGQLTTGTGRVAAPAQKFTYAFDVPPGKPMLAVTTTLATAGAGTDQIAGVLVAPNGEGSVSPATPNRTGSRSPASGRRSSNPSPVDGD